jgi:hypothetical protein
VECGLGVRIDILGFSNVGSFVSDGGAAKLALDFSRSTIPVPGDHTIKLTAISANGTPIATSDFPASNTNGHIKLDSPSAADTWLLNNLASASGIEVVLEPFASEDREGENTAIVEVELDSVVIRSRGQLWYVAGCNFSGSEACGTGF